MILSYVRFGVALNSRVGYLSSGLVYDMQFHTAITVMKMRLKHVGMIVFSFVCRIEIRSNEAT